MADLVLCMPKQSIYRSLWATASEIYPLQPAISKKYDPTARCLRVKCSSGSSIQPTIPSNVHPSTRLPQHSMIPIGVVEQPDEYN